MSKVDTVRKEYELLLPDVQKNRAVVKGERAIKEGQNALAYLPPLPSMCASLVEDEAGNQSYAIGSSLTYEGRASYNKYRSLAYFYAATGRTVDGLTGLIFAKSAKKDLPERIDYLNKNVNGRGDSIRTFSQRLVREAFQTPRLGVLVEFPKVEGRVTVAESERLNLRPRLVCYPFETIINWHYETIKNEETLTLVVLKETVNTQTERFSIEAKTQYRVLELIDGSYHQSLYDDKGDEINPPTQIMVNGASSSVIPFFEISCGEDNKTLIDDLADANLNHYRFFADYAAKEHASAFPIFFETGAVDEGKNVLIGPGSKWENPVTDATFGVVQTESDGGSMRTYLQDMEQRMAALGAEMLKPRINQAESAEAKGLDQVAQNSTTADLAMTVSDVMRKALQFCAKWMGVETEVIYELNTDYNPTGMNPQLLTALMNAVQVGEISSQTFYENLQKGEIANPERSFEDEQALITQRDMGE